MTTPQPRNNPNIRRAEPGIYQTLNGQIDIKVNQQNQRLSDVTINGVTTTGVDVQFEMTPPTEEEIAQHGENAAWERVRPFLHFGGGRSAGGRSIEVTNFISESEAAQLRSAQQSQRPPQQASNSPPQRQPQRQQGGAATHQQQGNTPQSQAGGNNNTRQNQNKTKKKAGGVGVQVLKTLGKTLLNLMGRENFMLAAAMRKVRKQKGNKFNFGATKEALKGVLKAATVVSSLATIGGATVLGGTAVGAGIAGMANVLNGIRTVGMVVDGAGVVGTMLKKDLPLKDRLKRSSGALLRIGLGIAAGGIGSGSGLGVDVPQTTLENVPIVGGAVNRVDGLPTIAKVGLVGGAALTNLRDERER